MNRYVSYMNSVYNMEQFSDEYIKVLMLKVSKYQKIDLVYVVNHIYVE